MLLHQKLQSDAVYAEDEEQWSDIIYERFLIEQRAQHEGKLDAKERQESLKQMRRWAEEGWADEIENAIKGMERMMQGWKLRWMDMGARMGEIVEKEQEFAGIERKWRREERQRRWNAKKSVNDGSEKEGPTSKVAWKPM